MAPYQLYRYEEGIDVMHENYMDSRFLKLYLFKTSLTSTSPTLASPLMSFRYVSGDDDGGVPYQEECRSLMMWIATMPRPVTANVVRAVARF